jgi:hypothetical protein
MGDFLRQQLCVPTTSPKILKTGLVIGDGLGDDFYFSTVVLNLNETWCADSNWNYESDLS